MKINFKELPLKNKQGFTLIELLVVVAIIGILSSVVLASLNTARSKGANAAVKANISGIRAIAELSYSNNNGYNLVCGDLQAQAALTAADSAGGGTSSAAGGAAKCFWATALSPTQWVAAAGLKTTEPGSITAWCADYTGNSIGITTAKFSSLTNSLVGTVCQ